MPGTVYRKSFDFFRNGLTAANLKDPAWIKVKFSVGMKGVSKHAKNNDYLFHRATFSRSGLGGNPIRRAGAIVGVEAGARVIGSRWRNGHQWRGPSNSRPRLRRGVALLGEQAGPFGRGVLALSPGLLFDLIIGILGLFGSLLLRWIFGFAMVVLLLVSAFVHVENNAFMLPSNFAGTPNDAIRFASLFVCGTAFYVFRDTVPYRNDIAVIAVIALFAFMFNHATAELAVRTGRLFDILVRVP